MKTLTILRKTLACTLALLLAIDIAAACRLWSSCDACSPAVSCEVSSPCGGCYPMDCGGCDPCDGGAEYSETVDEHEPLIAPEEPTPAAPAPFGEGEFSSSPLVEEPEAVAEAEEDIFDAAPTVIAPVEEEPEADWPAEEVAPPEEDIAEDLAAPAVVEDDMFGEPEPANEVESAFEESDPEADLFAEEPMVDEMPADEPMDDEEAEGDLFGEDAFAEDDMSEEPTDIAAPMDDFSDEPMDDDDAEDDLFGFGDDTETADEMPAEEPADDFGGFEDPASSAEDDLFGLGDEPVAEEAPVEDAFSDEGFDDGDFGEADFDADGFEGDAFEEPEAPSNDDAEDDLFGDFGMILIEPGGYDSDRPRTWIDNSGKFSCRARLIAVDGDTIRLHKADGGVSRVPLGRLSNADLEFVTRQVAARYDLELALGGTEVRTAAR